MWQLGGSLEDRVKKGALHRGGSSPKRGPFWGRQLGRTGDPERHVSVGARLCTRRVLVSVCESL